MALEFAREQASASRGVYTERARDEARAFDDSLDPEERSIDTPIIFPNCFAGAQALSVAKRDRTVEASDGTTVPYADDVTVCASCGETFYTHEQALASSRARAGALRTKDGLLTPDDIRALRQKYGLTQDGLERMLRVGPKTVVRWERGTVCQSAGIDTLMTLIRDEPSAARRLAARAGVDLEFGGTAASSIGGR